MSLQTGAHVASFRQPVRERDQRCVVSGLRARLSYANKWGSFEATHIFPLEFLGLWERHGFSSLITIPPVRESDGSINSDNYKIVIFTPELCENNRLIREEEIV
ncbi:hypothetical protein HOY82DRAFT_649632 [Tuber indicum]|nr:hypothetical protein HOY82DRAFT_649632 [Tuber indicum]